MSLSVFSTAAAAAGPALPPARSPARLREPEELHPQLWRAAALGRGSVAAGALASGYAELDAELPGCGWPAQALTELLLPHPGIGELRLLAPALAAVQAGGGSVMWFDPPAEPCAWGLGELGITTRRLVLVRSRAAPRALKGAARQRLPAADILWALEQTLKSGHAGAVLAWLPARLPADALRRLQLAAQAHDGPAFLLRGAEERLRPSPAPLRLLLASAGPDRLQVTLLKRRGPPALRPLRLALPPASDADRRDAAEVAAFAGFAHNV